MIKTVSNSKVTYETNYKNREKQVQKPEIIIYKDLTRPSAEHFQATFLSINPAQKTIDKGLAQKALTQLKNSFDFSQSIPKEVAIYRRQRYRYLC